MFFSHIVAEVKYISAVMADKLGEINTDLLLLHVFVFITLESGTVHISVKSTHSNVNIALLM